MQMSHKEREIIVQKSVFIKNASVHPVPYKPALWSRCQMFFVLLWFFAIAPKSILCCQMWAYMWRIEKELN